ncbi:hypothetical protein [Microbacterium sp. bgisy189]|uniref:hypothetical protein n=1 Tax=Microbacterium sp. bgisy189 TaxID=3413798 RepID=UPI003EBBD9D7
MSRSASRGVRDLENPGRGNVGAGPFRTQPGTGAAGALRHEFVVQQRSDLLPKALRTRATAVNDPTVPVTGALCFIEADWPLIGGSFIVNGVHVLWPRLLVKRLTTATETDVDVDAVATRIAGAFPRAV